MKKEMIWLVLLIGVGAFCAGTVQAGQAFEDVTEGVGLKGMPNAAGAWGDYDNDGWVDLYVGGALWRNEGGKKFARVSGQPLSGGGGLWGDFDNDGYLDLYCWGNGKLFRNVEGKSFADASNKLPPRPMKTCRGAVWGDLDGDGYLDLYVGGYEIWDTQEEFPDVIYRNTKGESFTEIWRTQGTIYRARGITAVDFDDDGDLDVHVSNYRLQVNQLWRNNGKGVFTDVAQEYGLVISKGKWKGHTIGSAWADLDNDGHLDLFVGNFSHPAAYQDRPVFLRNRGPDGKFHFEDKSAGAGLRWQESYASPSFGDFDNDGRVDLFFTTVYGGDKSVLYRNLGGWTFNDHTQHAGVATDRTYQSAWADFDNDGDLDLLSGGKLFRNPGNDNHWLKVSLKGSGTVSRTPFGAQVRIRMDAKTLTRQVEAATGEGNQNDLTVHFGLGEHGGEVALEIRWPGGGVQKLTTGVDKSLPVTKAP